MPRPSRLTGSPPRWKILTLLPTSGAGPFRPLRACEPRTEPLSGPSDSWTRVRGSREPTLLLLLRITPTGPGCPHSSPHPEGLRGPGVSFRRTVSWVGPSVSGSVGSEIPEDGYLCPNDKLGISTSRPVSSETLEDVYCTRTTNWGFGPKEQTCHS